MRALGLAALLLALLPFTVAAEPRCRANSDGSWESYDSASGVTIASGGASGCPGGAPVAVPPVVVLPTWVPALPTYGYVDLYQGANGPRGNLEPYEPHVHGAGGYKWRSPWVCNLGAAPILVTVTVNGVGSPGRVNAAIYVRDEHGNEARPAHVNIAAVSDDTSEHNDDMTVWLKAQWCYQLYTYQGLPEFVYEMVAP